MLSRSIARTLVVATALALGASGNAAARQPSSDTIPALLATLEQLVQAPDGNALDGIAPAGPARDALSEFLASWRREGISRVTMRLRDRAPADGGITRLIVEVLIEQGDYARVATWQIDVQDVAQVAHVAAIRTMGSVDGLYRLSFDSASQFAASNLHLAAEDFQLTLPRGSVFAVPAGSGVTALVLIGRGQMTFRPTPETERGQLRIFAGSDTLQTPFDAAFVRLNPLAFDSLVSSASLTPQAADARAVRDAQAFFREQMPRSFGVDLADLSREAWSLLPPFEDVLVDVKTRRLGTLTYARSSNEPEDITLFDRDRHRTIALYRSKTRVAASGRFYDEDELADFDILDHTIDTAFTPERLWFDGRSRLRLQVRAASLASVTLRLASELVVRSVTSEQYGRLLFLRVRNQDSLIVNLPSPLSRGDELTLSIVYAGRLEPVKLDGEALHMAGQIVRPSEAGPVIVPEPSYLYSNRGYWYPQGSITDYASATLRVTVPTSVTAVCSGEPAEGSPVPIRTAAGQRQLFVFTTPKPVRYLGCVFARFGAADTRQVTLAHASTADPILSLNGRSPARQRNRLRELLDQAEDIVQFYSALMGDAPFPVLTLAVVESELPGGQSPAYFAALNQPLPSSPYTWRNDPASFDNYPEFFLAHELAHQWWGHAIGGNSYHEQWLSEGFAQYFAALYAERRRGPEVFASILRTMQRWSVSMSPEGPVFLGFRLGHLQNDSRIFRALVYDKGAMVLHMLRRLLGDETFFAGLRRFYAEHRFTKTSTAALQQAFEQAAGRSLQLFFDGWIYSAELPVVAVASRTEQTGAAKMAVIRIEQTGRVFEFPLTIRLQFSDGSTRDLMVPVRGRTTEHRIPIAGTLRGIEINRDRAALVGGED